MGRSDLGYPSSNALSACMLGTSQAINGFTKTFSVQPTVFGVSFILFLTMLLTETL